MTMILPCYMFVKCFSCNFLLFYMKKLRIIVLNNFSLDRNSYPREKCSEKFDYFSALYLMNISEQSFPVRWTIFNKANIAESLLEYFPKIYIGNSERLQCHTISTSLSAYIAVLFVNKRVDAKRHEKFGDAIWG